MTVQQIRMCLEIDRQGSISKAAETLFLSQPNLSRALRELEQELGVILFERTPSGVVPTKEGERFIKEGQEIVLAMDRLSESFNKEADLGLSVASVSCPRLSSALAQAIASIEGAPKEIKVRIGDNNSVFAALSEGKAHLGLVRYPISQGENLITRLNRLGLSYRRWWKVKPHVGYAPHSWPGYESAQIRTLWSQGQLISGSHGEWSGLPKLKSEYLNLQGDDVQTWLLSMFYSFTIALPKEEKLPGIEFFEIKEAEDSLHWLLWYPGSLHEPLIRAWDSEYDHTD